MKRNLKLTIAYEGAAYKGWQIQRAGVPTVQETLQRAIQQIVRQPVWVIGAGRTDSGVHALGQVAHCHTSSRLPAAKLLRAFNAVLPDDIVVRQVEDVPLDFHARHQARGKLYRYRIQTGRTPDLFERRSSWFVARSLDVEAMQDAGDYLVGRHDFASFERESRPDRSSVRTIFRVEVARQGHIIRCDVEGDGFLYNMVRAIAGTLVDVGTGKRFPLQVREILEARDRRAAGPTAPPHGLFLCWVKY
jgi:tRNA pseudouridine38-40 synthase